MWRKRVGKDEARRITLEACNIGTSMHKFLECHLLEEEREYVPSLAHSQASKMSGVVIKEGLKHVSEIWGTEVKLWYKDQYAGTTDVVGVYKGIPHIIDFKQTNKPKKAEWIDDYYLQLCAYAHAHNEMFGTEMKSGVVLMCSRDLQFQKFELSEVRFEKYSYMWWNRVNEYSELVSMCDA